MNIGFLHFKTVSISPKLSLGIKSIEHFEIHCHVFASSIAYWNWIKFHINFHHVIEVLGVSNSDFGSLLSIAIVQINGPLLKEFSILIENIFAYLRENHGSWLIICRYESVLAFTLLRLQLFIFIILQPVAEVFARGL